MPPGIKKPAGEWNTSRIRVAPEPRRPGRHARLSLLEQRRGSSSTSSIRRSCDAAIEKSKFKGIERFGKLQKGHILLQDHGDQVWYRNIKIQRLTP